VPLVIVRVVVVLKVAEAKPAALGPPEILVLLVPFMPEAGQDLPGPLDHLGELGALPAEGHADRVLAVQVFVADPVADDCIGLATTPGAPEANIISRA